MNEKSTKKRILDAAEKLFAIHGFDGTSLRAITTEAKVNLASVNYHFQTKEALMDAVKRAHSYENPEIIGLPIAVGSPEYMQWISHEITR